MRIVHCFPWSKVFSIDWIKYINKYFFYDEHIIFIYEEPDYEGKRNLSQYKNVNLIGTAKRNFILGFDKKQKNQLDKADSIILHCASFYLLLALGRNFKWLKKTRIVCWGGDIEVLKKSNYTNMQSLKLFLKRQIMKSSFSKVKKVGFLIEEDRLWVEKIIPRMKNMEIVNYLMQMRAEREKYINHSKRSGEIVKIVLGNSATETNNHFEIIEKLAQYAEQYYLFVPLSYGDIEYRNKVIDFGRKMLAEKFVPIIEYMPINEYINFISSMDIAVFNHRRQQALGNIDIAFQSGLKVYLNAKSPCWEHFKKSGYRFYNVEEIGQISFKDLYSISKQDLDKNRRLLLKTDEIFKDNIENWNSFMKM